jgi:hypothetical protein
LPWDARRRAGIPDVKRRGHIHERNAFAIHLYFNILQIKSYGYRKIVVATLFKWRMLASSPTNTGNYGVPRAGPHDRPRGIVCRHVGFSPARVVNSPRAGPEGYQGYGFQGMSRTPHGLLPLKKTGLEECCRSGGRTRRAENKSRRRQAGCPDAPPPDAGTP